MSSTQFDIVIPVGPNDIKFIWPNIARNKENIVGHRNVYILTKDPSALDVETLAYAEQNKCILIDEATFPFKMGDVIEIHKGVNWRNGWYLQQLLKLYAGFVIPDILPTYLVVDADTVFLRPTTFLSQEGKYLFNIGSEYHRPYFLHMERMHPTFQKQVRPSGICHHMLFNRDYVQKMMAMVEATHHLPFWRVFLEKVSDILGSGASEYEMYFNYLIKYHPEVIQIRMLRWTNAPTILENLGLDYVSVHHYMRK